MNCRNPFGMENHVHGVVRNAGLHVIGLVKNPKQALRRLVADADVPAPVDDDAGIRLLLPQDKIQRLAHRLQIPGRQSLVAIGRHEACGDVQGVALLQRQVERAAEQLHHFAARLRAAGFQKADVPSRYVGIARKLDLGKSANVAPVFQQGAEMSAGSIMRDRILNAHGRVS